MRSTAVEPTSDERVDERALLTELVGDGAATWDLSGLLPEELLREVGARGLLCAQVPVADGGLGFTSLRNGEFTAHVGSLCSSLRSVFTSQGMAAWTVSRLGDTGQRRRRSRELTTGTLAAVGFSENEAGSDLSAITTRIEHSGDSVILDGAKKWVTAASYADLFIVFGRYQDAAAAVVVPRGTPGVTVSPVASPLGCRAAGHAHLRFDSVRLDPDSLLGGGGHSLSLLVTTALAYGRMSVAWGCAGILRACLRATVAHATSRTQFGSTLAGHQLVARQLAELLVAEQNATRACEHASRCWDARSPELVTASVLAKYLSSRAAAKGASRAVQVLASAAAQDGELVARAYRDAKLMEIIEGSNEICQLLLAEHAISTVTAE